MSKYADCSNCGQCCEHFPIEVTPSELGEMRRAAPELAVNLKLTELYDSNILIEPHCPFHVDSRCAVQGVKPFACHAYLCGRVDPLNEEVNPKRMEDPEYRAIRDPYYEKGLAWGKAHGWKV